METKVRYLVDTNVWLERLLDQEKSDIASEFLNSTPTDSLFVSDFSIHSIGVILSRLKKYEIFKKLINDLFVNGQIELLTLDSIDLLDVIDNQIRLRVVFFRPNMKPQLYYIPADAHKRVLTMGIQYFVSL